MTVASLNRPMSHNHGIRSLRVGRGMAASNAVFRSIAFHETTLRFIGSDKPFNLCRHGQQATYQRKKERKDNNDNSSKTNCATSTITLL